MPSATKMQASIAGARRTSGSAIRSKSPRLRLALLVRPVQAKVGHATCGASPARAARTRAFPLVHAARFGQRLKRVRLSQRLGELAVVLTIPRAADFFDRRQLILG